MYMSQYLRLFHRQPTRMSPVIMNLGGGMLFELADFVSY